MKSLSRFLVLAFCLALTVGCSSSGGTGKAEPEFTVLQEVNDLLHSATGPGGRPPSKVADLDKFQNMYPRAYAAIKSGDVIVVWTVPMKGEGEGGKDETIAAYEKNTPKDGGYILTAGGVVKKINASDFTAPKAGKK